MLKTILWGLFIVSVVYIVIFLLYLLPDFEPETITCRFQR